MKLLRLWKQYDSIKAAVLLGALSAVLAGLAAAAFLRLFRLAEPPAE